MKKYNINENTMAIIPINKNISKIIEKNGKFLVKMNSMSIIKKSCEYFGSSYIGRHEGTKSLIGVKYKSPIIIEESKNIIYFPTISPRLEGCMWISLNNVDNYEKIDRKTKILFINGDDLILDLSYETLNNQYLKATKLDYVLNKRKK